jgi:tetratricopeptide (TPR) repeat protein
MKRSKYYLVFAVITITCSALFSSVYGQGGDSKAEIDHYSNRAISMSQKKTALDIVKATIDSAETICNKENIEIPAVLHLARAEYFFLTADFNSATQEAEIAADLSESSDDTEVLLRTYDFLARYNLRTGFFTESIGYFEKSIQIAEDKNLSVHIPKIYRGLVNVYDALDDLEQYNITLDLLIKAAIAENDTSMLEDGTFLLGTSMADKMGNFALADSLLNTCLSLSLARKDTSFSALSLANLGWNFYLNKQYDKSLECYKRSLTFSLPSGLHQYSANAYGNMGTIYRDIGDPEEAVSYYQKSIKQAEVVNDIYNLSWVHKDMSELYLRRKDTSNAYRYFVLYKEYSDSLLIYTSNQGMTDARIRYDADSHRKELELMQLKFRNQNLLIYGSAGLVILSLVIGLLLLSRSRVKTRQRISEMNRKISEVTQANLRQQMNPHFIFNTLNSIQYYMYRHDKLATNNYLTKFSSLMRKVLENSQHTSVPLRDELDALNLYLELEQIRFKDKFDYKIIIDEELDVLQYKVPTMLIQPYVENSICHGLIPADGKGMVKIDLKLDSEFVKCTIEDNGIGREEAQRRKNDNNENHNSLGTQIVSSRLDLVNTLYGTSLKTIYTDLRNYNGKAEGTKVELHIPIMS